MSVFITTSLYGDQPRGLHYEDIMKTCRVHAMDLYPS